MDANAGVVLLARAPMVLFNLTLQSGKNLSFALIDRPGCGTAALARAMVSHLQPH